MPRRIIAIAAAGLALVSFSAARAAYLDDRSDAVALVKSLYNAIGNKEYARAWTYFAEPPSPDFDAYAKGYETTQSVELKTGAAFEDAAAGSEFWQVPVALRALDTAGTERVFTGCYTVRLANPQAQGVPYQPMAIHDAKLNAVETPFEETAPTGCEGAADQAGDPVLEEAKARFAATHAGRCRAADDTSTEPAGGAPEVYEIRYKDKGAAESDPERVVKIVRLFCDSGAYNESHAFYIKDDIEGLRELHFARPELDIKYENDDFEGKVENVTIAGYTAGDLLTNSSYDAQAQTITEFAKWRGVGDASTTGQWVFREGRFVLVSYEVDASYDGEINPEQVLDHASAP